MTLSWCLSRSTLRSRKPRKRNRPWKRQGKQIDQRKQTILRNSRNVGGSEQFCQKKLNCWTPGFYQEVTFTDYYLIFSKFRKRAFLAMLGSHGNVYIFISGLKSHIKVMNVSNFPFPPSSLHLLVLFPWRTVPRTGRRRGTGTMVSLSPRGRPPSSRPNPRSTSKRRRKKDLWTKQN